MLTGTLAVNNNLSLNGGNYVFDCEQHQPRPNYDRWNAGPDRRHKSSREITGSPAVNGLYPLILATGGVSGAAGNISPTDRFSQAIDSS